MMMNLCEQISRIKQVMKLNESEDNDSDFIFSLFDDFTKDADLYFNPDTESIWMIFPEEKIWVFQLEKDGDLWYYYHFFDGIFKYLSLDVIDNQDYITKWVEDTLKRGVKHTHRLRHKKPKRVEDTLKRGVKHTLKGGFLSNPYVEDILKRGVRYTRYSNTLHPPSQLETPLKWRLNTPEEKLNNNDEPK